MITEAVLHLHVDRAAQRIETESRIVGHDRDRSYRGGRNQIPVDRVAERFVDAHPVLVNRKSLRCAGHRRSDEAAKLHVGLKRIAGDFTDNDARHVFLQGIGDVQRSSALDLSGIDGIERWPGTCRHQLHQGSDRQVASSQKTTGIGGRLTGGRIFRTAMLDAWLRLGNHDRWQFVNRLGGDLGADDLSLRKQAYRHHDEESSAHPPPPVRRGMRRLANGRI